jgi:hypothetical protein
MPEAKVIGTAQQSRTRAELARDYFSTFLKDPSSVELAGYLDDIRSHGKGVPDTGLSEFADELQKQMEIFVRSARVPGGIKLPSETFKEASCRLAEARHLLDVLHKASYGSEPLNRLTIPSCIGLAERLLGEAHDLLADPAGTHQQAQARA